MANDYNLLRSVLNMNDDDDKKMAEILSDMQREEIDANIPDGSPEDEEYTPEKTEGKPIKPKEGMDEIPPNPPGRDEVCARFFLQINEKDKIPEARMKRTNVYDVAISSVEGVSYTKRKRTSTRKPEEIDGEREGYFYKATVNIKGGEMITIPGIVYGDWISSYSTNPEGIKVDFFKNNLGQRYVLSPTDIVLTYIVGIDKQISAVMKHGPGSPTAIKGISMSDLKTHPEYEDNMSVIDDAIREKCKDFMDNDPNPPINVEDYATWVKNYWKWFGFNETPQGKKGNDPCAYQHDEDANQKLESGDNTFNAMKLRLGACRHKASGFFVLATYAGVPCHYITNDCHAFVEIWVPGIGWNMYDLGGCSPPGQDPQDEPLDPDKKWEAPPDSPQNPPPKPDDPNINGADLLTKQINAIATKSKKEGVGCDVGELIKGLWDDANTNKRGRFF